MTSSIAEIVNTLLDNRERGEVETFIDNRFFPEFD